MRIKSLIVGAVVYYAFLFYVIASIATSKSLLVMLLCPLLYVLAVAVATFALMFLYVILSCVSLFFYFLIGLPDVADAMNNAHAHLGGFVAPFVVFMLFALPIKLIIENPYIFPFLSRLFR